jgi:hypothetical protein
MLSIRRTEELRDALKFKYPNMVNMLAIAGINLVFLNHSDGRFAAYDFKTLSEISRFNVGSPIQAPPTVNYSISGKQ